LLYEQREHIEGIHGGGSSLVYSLLKSGYLGCTSVDAPLSDDGIVCKKAMFYFQIPASESFEEFFRDFVFAFNAKEDTGDLAYVRIYAKGSGHTSELAKYLNLLPESIKFELTAAFRNELIEFRFGGFDSQAT
jgi:hypothetical protein